MRTQPPETWITGEEFAEARRNLIESGHRHDSVEMHALNNRVVQRDEYLWSRYAKSHIRQHSGEWAAVGINGEILFGPTVSAVMAAASDRFGHGNFVYGRMADFRGRVLHRC